MLGTPHQTQRAPGPATGNTTGVLPKTGPNSTKDNPILTASQVSTTTFTQPSAAHQHLNLVDIKPSPNALPDHHAAKAVTHLTHKILTTLKADIKLAFVTDEKGHHVLHVEKLDAIIQVHQGKISSMVMAHLSATTSHYADFHNAHPSTEKKDAAIAKCVQQLVIDHIQEVTKGNLSKGAEITSDVLALISDALNCIPLPPTMVASGAAKILSMAIDAGNRLLTERPLIKDASGRTLSHSHSLTDLAKAGASELASAAIGHIPVAGGFANIGLSAAKVAAHLPHAPTFLA